MGFAIKKDIVTKLTDMSRPVSDRIMTMRLPLSKDNFTSIISVYAPTMTNPDENKETFYNQAGVGFAIKKDIATKLTEMPRPVNDRIMTMRLPLSKDNFTTIISDKRVQQ